MKHVPASPKAEPQVGEIEKKARRALA